jgi:erythromycin esterase
VATRLLPLLLLAFLLGPSVEARRRAVRHPERLPDSSSPAAWLLANAHVLHSTEVIPSTDDLAPLRTIVGEATVVGLGDGTHGTHEFTTVKMRLIDYLARAKGFDVVAFEAPFPVMNRVNTYVQGGAGDLRAILRDGATRLNFWFWYTEEMVEVFERLRTYNAQRGNAPAIEVVGTDMADDSTAVADVLAYLRVVDPAYAAQAESEYACVGTSRSQACMNAVARVRTEITARATQYLATSTERAYHDALRNASIILRDDRDTLMAEGVLWARDHRGTNGKVFYWAHNEHVSKNNGSTDAGRILRFALGSSYVVIATMSGPGNFAGWRLQSATRDQVVAPLPEILPGSYESYFRERGVAAMLVPAQGNVPDWLRGPATYRTGSTDGSSVAMEIELPLSFDAVIYVAQTTPVEALQ